MLHCKDEPYRKQCGCQRIDSVTGLEAVNMPTCTPWDLANCTQAQVNMELIQSCAKQCFPRWIEVNYQEMVTSAPFDPYILQLGWKNDSRVQELIERRALLEVLYEHFQYVHIRLYWIAG